MGAGEGMKRVLMGFLGNPNLYAGESYITTALRIKHSVIQECYGGLSGKIRKTYRNPSHPLTSILPTLHTTDPIGSICGENRQSYRSACGTVAKLSVEEDEAGRKYLRPGAQIKISQKLRIHIQSAQPGIQVYGQKTIGWDVENMAAMTNLLEMSTP